MRTALLLALLPLLARGQDSDSKSLVRSAQSKMKSGDFKGAESDLTRAIELEGKSSKTCYLRGTCRFSLGDYDAAAADFSEAIAAGERRAGAFTARGMARYLSGDPKGAISDLSEGPDDPRDFDPLFFRGHAYYAIDAWANALRDYRAALASEPAKADSLRLAIWLARAHLGERRVATEELLANLPKGRAGLMARYLAGETSEDDLLRDVALEPVNSRAEMNAGAWYYIGSKRLLDGKEDPESFRKALKSTSSSGTFEAPARAQLDAWAARDRKKLLDAQEGRVRALKRFHAEYRLRELSENGEEANKADGVDFILDVDRENKRLSGSIPKGTPKYPDGVRVLYDKDTMTAWSTEGSARRMDWAALSESVYRWDSSALEQLDRIVPPASGPRTPEPKEMMLVLQLEAKPSAGGNGTFRVAIGRGSHPSSWTRDDVDLRGTTVREQGDEVIIDIPAKKKRVVVDRAFGIPKLIEVTDYDGKRRQVVRTAFSADGEFPVVKPPAKVVPAPVDALIEGMWYENLASMLCSRLEEAIERWDRIKASGKEKDVRTLFGGWLTEYLDKIHQFNVHRAARQYIQWTLGQGAKMADLQKDPGEYITRFKAWSAQGRDPLQKFMRAQLENLTRQLNSEILERPLDSRLHPVLRQLRKELFDFDALELIRSAGDDEKADRIFREELEAARQL